MNNNNCFINLIKLIILLQTNSINNCLNKLGQSNNSTYNTRIISIYKKDGTILNTTYQLNNQTQNSNIFRIKELNNNCLTLLIISNQNSNYYSTNQYITLDINCIAAIRCLNDVNITNL